MEGEWSVALLFLNWIVYSLFGTILYTLQLQVSCKMQETFSNGPWKSTIQTFLWHWAFWILMSIFLYALLLLSNAHLPPEKQIILESPVLWFLASSFPWAMATFIFMQFQVPVMDGIYDTLVQGTEEERRQLASFWTFMFHLIAILAAFQTMIEFGGWNGWSSRIKRTQDEQRSSRGGGGGAGKTPFLQDWILTSLLATFIQILTLNVLCRVKQVASTAPRTATLFFLAHWGSWLIFWTLSYLTGGPEIQSFFQDAKVPLLLCLLNISFFSAFMSGFIYLAISFLVLSATTIYAYCCRRGAGEGGDPGQQVYALGRCAGTVAFFSTASTFFQLLLEREG